MESLSISEDDVGLTLLLECDHEGEGGEVSRSDIGSTT